MTRRHPPKLYQEVVIGPAQSPVAQAPADWNPLDDYKAANPPGQALSAGALLQNAAVRSLCSCRNCVARPGVA
ncbi:hypothetical protein [Kitasatospora brasiliensis]|uniref:hypothetical protein n=1 Tax=Kitasatospora brasiliensis TaxID=3058040 RepID=UPI0029306940|nr:hypothetical protein [Kitasatospora sp. K002]